MLLCLDVSLIILPRVVVNSDLVNMEAVTLCVAAAVVLLAVIWWRVRTYPRARPLAIVGLDTTTSVPCTEPVELYYNDMSAHSLKVRVSLAEAGVQYRGHYLRLLDGWDTKTAEFLAVNPAGTVPLLVHEGHPVYESVEQMLYVAQALAAAAGCKNKFTPLLPVDPDLRTKVIDSVRATALLDAEDLFSDPAACLRRSPSNVIFPMTIPLFGALFSRLCTVGSLLSTLPWLPFLPAKALKLVGFKIAIRLFGAEGLRKIGPLLSVAKRVRWALDFHLAGLEAKLDAVSPHPYLFGEQYTLADICWLPFLQRMEQARWWPEFEGQYPLVQAYWARLRAREATQACRPGPYMAGHLEAAGLLLDAWKADHVWFREIYTG